MRKIDVTSARISYWDLGNRIWMMQFDRNKSLDVLESADWGEPNFDSQLVRTCHHLRRIAVGDFSNGDLRIMIGQHIGLSFLVPIAEERLEVDPLAEGNFYAGDLLAAVLRIDDKFWTTRPDLADRLRVIVARVAAMLPDMEEREQQFTGKLLADGAQNFQ